ncbi:MAG TPA: hypothetical protein VJ256_07150 [Dehalococcoidia bacterium]|nr:hypothetical protein [Dehalococcoidia bacterium]
MTTQEMKRIHERNARAFELPPTAGQGTATTKVRVRSGLTCDIENGTYHVPSEFVFVACRKW